MSESSRNLAFAAKWALLSRYQDIGASHMPCLIDLSRERDLMCTSDQLLLEALIQFYDDEQAYIQDQEPPSEYDLKKLIRDPAYWRDQEPEIVKRVRDGFRKLYPDDEAS